MQAVKVQQDQQDQLVQQVPHRQFQVQQDLQVPLEPQDQLDLQDQLAPLRQSLDLQDPQDQPVQTVQQDLQVQLGQQALHIH
jgi:hypothetical protein